MREVEVRLPPTISDSAVEGVVERVCREAGLQVGLRGSLASYPGSRHWHLKQPDQRGTLEITFAPRSARIWLAVQAGREAVWIDEAIHSLARRLELALEQAAAQR